MKRIFACVLCIVLCVGTALAATQEDLADCAVANGHVAAVEFVDVVAPCSGVLESFDLAQGDAVEEGQELFSMMTTKIVATEDAVVRRVFAQPGDRAESVLSRYGALVSMEPVQERRIMASTSGAYDSDKNKTIHVGETLYFRTTGESKVEGSGMVISVSGENYVVDILRGDFVLGEQLALYRDDDYNSKDKVGRGTVTRRDPLSVVGTGVIASVDVREGQTVKQGDVLLTVMGADADDGASAIVTAPSAGVISALPVSSGQQVWKGQLLARVSLTSDMEVVVDVDEVYIGNLEVGDKLYLTLDTNEDEILTGTITEISAVGVTVQNAAYYTVHLRVDGSKALMLGQSAKVYVPK